ncbi:hypothetical protein QBC34DRAFT_297593 [Podospora aff. communis PSN243]|uniref:Ig-like domain-containing protein n=1 Tax=Podospora aff. communis PSN243 TaxID=3040156 RepID=A0AAV9GUB0_9PEZI|nr:hypothetical protein QBC34DRAFT_297593 [Podospora aff. communis PSN243]
MTIRGQFWYPRPLWAPSPPPPPPNTKKESCLNRHQIDSLHVWTVTEFLYQRTNISLTGMYGPGIFADGLPYPHSTTLTLTLRNEANDYTTTCTHTSPSLPTPLSPSQWLPCNPPIPPHTFPRYVPTTHISFNPLTGELRLNQTWYCAPTQSATPFQVAALGSTSHAYDKFIGGHSSSTATNVVCGNLIAPLWCNITYTADWWSLGGDRDGKGTPIRVGTNFGRDVTVTRLPGDAFRAPEPEEGRWSCTVNSLGRGPVKWRLQVDRYLALTAWYGYGREDVTYTRVRFDLNSSVFWGREGGGIVKGVGNERSADSGRGTAYLGSWESAMVRTTPWVASWDPSWTFRSGERYGGEARYEDLGWDVYNVLDWSVRFDVPTGYMELKHSWYCDDMNPGDPFGNDTAGLEEGIVCLPTGGNTVVVTPVVTAEALHRQKIPDPK